EPQAGGPPGGCGVRPASLVRHYCPLIARESANPDSVSRPGRRRPRSAAPGGPSAPGRPGGGALRPHSMGGPVLPQPGAQLLGVRMAQIFEESQGLLPGTAGGGTVAGRLMRVAEVNQRLGPVVAIAQVPVDVDGLLIPGDGFGVIAQPGLRVSEGVQRGGLIDLVPQLAVNGDGLGPVIQRL